MPPRTAVENWHLGSNQSKPGETGDSPCGDFQNSSICLPEAVAKRQRVQSVGSGAPDLSRRRPRLEIFHLSVPKTAIFHALTFITTTQRRTDRPRCIAPAGQQRSGYSSTISRTSTSRPSSPPPGWHQETQPRIPSQVFEVSVPPSQYQRLGHFTPPHTEATKSRP